MSKAALKIAVLGASGLIGENVTKQLMAADIATIAFARHFSQSQRRAFVENMRELPVVGMTAAALAKLFGAESVDIVVNCIGVLQDGPGGSTADVHAGFTERLLLAMGKMDQSPLLVQFSVPGDAAGDSTQFSQTKRIAERAISQSGVPYVILRPGFVIAQAAYGGSALIRALAVMPFGLSRHASEQAFTVTSIDDIGRTIIVLAQRWRRGERDWAATWDIMASETTSVGDVVSGFRAMLGGPRTSILLPDWLMGAGALAGDWAGMLGWRPPIRTTALAEMRRGVAGNPKEWMAATGLEPQKFEEILSGLPSTIQEKWFARLYLLKGLIFVGLVLFWISSGFIALTIAFDAATEILTRHGAPLEIARLVTVFTSLLDIAVGLAIGVKKTSKFGLMAGIGVSIFYMVGAALLTPDLWVEPLGALVKTGPAIVLMLVALAIFEDR